MRTKLTKVSRYFCKLGGPVYKGIGYKRTELPGNRIKLLQTKLKPRVIRVQPQHVGSVTMNRGGRNANIH